MQDVLVVFVLLEVRKWYDRCANPTGDSFDIDYVAHEIGHQMGYHTHNGTANCRKVGIIRVNRKRILNNGFAGICDGQNVQDNSDDYFNM
jgi:hypothetical protein